jgi:hypothetical protein
VFPHPRARRSPLHRFVFGVLAAVAFVALLTIGAIAGLILLIGGAIAYGVHAWRTRAAGSPARTDRVVIDGSCRVVRDSRPDAGSGSLH